MDFLTSGQWQAWPFVQACIKAAFLLLGFKMGLFFFEGYQIRMKFRQMKEQGIAIAEPHSLVWGHLKMMVAIRAHSPQDAHNHYAQIYMVQNWQKFFPGVEERPPILYFDLWPVLDPFAFVVDPAMCQDIVQDRIQPRHPQIKHLIKYISGERNLMGWDQPVHTLWRSRLNPGFSARNLQSHMPTFIEEVQLFVELLKAKAPKDGSWGDMFQLLDRTTNMTFDIICRIAINLNTNEQREGPTELQNSMRTLVRDHVIFKNLGTLMMRLDPRWNLQAWRCNRVLRRTLMPRIQEQIGSGEQTTTQKTVIQLATKEISNEVTATATGGTKTTKAPLDKAQYSEDVLNLMKQFLFAGHDTTSTTITWAFHFLAKHPAALEQLRAEHTAVFGPDPATAAAALAANPAMLNAMPYTNAVIKEVLRLSPLAATIRRGSPSFYFTHTDQAGNTRHYPTDGFAVATGTAAMHHDPALFPRADEFLPERYLVPKGHELYPVNYAWRPFEYGPFNCIGQDLALMELRLVLLLTVRELDIECDWERWDALQGRVAGDEKPPTVNGDRAYRTTNGLSYPTDELPVHVRLRNP